MVAGYDRASFALPPAVAQEQVKLGRLLGAGAAACVYAAEWRGQQVAVKLAHPSSADPKAFARYGRGGHALPGANSGAGVASSAPRVAPSSFKLEVQHAG